MNIEEQIEGYINSQPEPKRNDMEELHRFILGLMPGCRIWFLDGKDESGRTVSIPYIGYGLLTISYADGQTRDGFKFGPLGYKSSGTLSWNNLRVGGRASGPSTDVPAWLAPRNVPGAASVTTPAGETERYLFYRGVGHIDAPLSVARSSDDS